MKRLLWIVLALAGFAAQAATTGVVQVVDTVPAGSCNTKTVRVVKDDAGNNGEHYCCVSGTWASCDVGAGGGGADGLGPDGDKGDITVGGSGTTLTIDANAVQTDEIDLSIAPSWTGTHTFGVVPYIENGLCWDATGDGTDDSCIIGDYDNDGSLEIEDDIDAVYDLGIKNIYLLPGTYDDPGSDTASGNSFALIEIPDNGSLICYKGAIIDGYDPSGGPPVEMEGDGTDQSLHIIYMGNNSTLSGCEIDGNVPTDGTDVSGLNDNIMNTYVSGKSNVVIHDIYSHNSDHSCIYAKNFTNLRVTGSRLEDCGNYGGTNPTTYPAIYLYADGSGGTADGAWIEGNVARRVGGYIYSTRRASALDTVKNIHWRDNYAEDHDPAAAGSISFRGCQRCSAVGNVIYNANGIEVYDGGSAGGYADNVENSEQIYISGNYVDVAGNGQFALRIGEYPNDVIVAGDNTFIGTPNGLEMIDDPDLVTNAQTGRFDVNYGGPWFIRKKAGETITSDSTYTDDAELKFHVEDETNYWFKFVIFVTSTTTADFKHQLTCPAGSANVMYFEMHGQSGNTDMHKQVPKTSCSSGMAITADFVSDGTIPVIIEGSMQVNAEGTIAWQWAQNTSDATNTTVEAGSYVTWGIID